MAVYPDMSTINASTDATKILVYANDITGGVFGNGLLVSFFLIALFGTYFYQLRTSGRGRIGVCFAAASFVTFGLSILMSQTTGLIAPSAVFITLALAIIGIIWLFFSSEPA